MDTTGQDKQPSDLREEIIRLGPWHIEVQVTLEISTRAFLDAPEGTYESSRELDPRKVSFVNSRGGFTSLLQTLYPDGLEGRTFLDCACNCGAYSFWAKELGASECFGFDVHEHWIDQANFLAANRVWPSDGVRFGVHDLYDLPKLGLEPFDVTLFQGIFYHLPDPISGLKVAADLTREVIVVDTATRSGLPDGFLSVGQEGREHVMTGVYGLNWFPTGPEVMTQILNWMGFPETKVLRWLVNTRPDRPDVGRLRMIAARDEGILDAVEAQPEPRERDEPGFYPTGRSTRSGLQSDSPEQHIATLRTRNANLLQRLERARAKNQTLTEQVEQLEEQLEAYRNG